MSDTETRKLCERFFADHPDARQCGLMFKDGFWFVDNHGRPNVTAEIGDLIAIGALTVWASKDWHWVPWPIAPTSLKDAIELAEERAKLDAEDAARRAKKP